MHIGSIILNFVDKQKQGPGITWLNEYLFGSYTVVLEKSILRYFNLTDLNFVLCSDKHLYLS
jgi:hypothetical protein